MSTIKPLSVSAKRLAQTIAGSASTFKLDNILTWDGTTDLVAGDFGTVAYAAFRNSAGTLIEFMAIDPSTIASASITILYRGLAYNGGNLTTEIAANKLTWVKGDTIVELGTHLPQLLAHYVDIVGDQTIAGAKTFSSAPASSSAAVTSTELVRKNELDAAVLGGITVAPVVIPGTAGETLAIDQHVYLKASDQRWWLADADTAATVDNVILGITRGAGSAAGAITAGVTVLGEHIAASAIFTAGKVFASDTAGSFATSAGTVEVSLGIAISTTKIDFSARYDQTITEDIQDALAGSGLLLGASSTNKYVTQEGLQNLGAENFGVSAVGTDAYAVTYAPAITALVNGHHLWFEADVANTGACTFDPNGLGALAITKLNDQVLATGDIEVGQIVELIYDLSATAWQMVSQTALAPATVDVQTFTVDGTYTKPAGALKMRVEIWGGGGGSGGCTTNQSSAAGGGGGYFVVWFEAADVGATETVTLGAGGAAGASGDNDGGDGGNTTFGSLATAYGGTLGQGAGGANTEAGGAGGGSGVDVAQAANTASYDVRGGGGGAQATAGGRGIKGGGGGTGGETATAGGASIWGGGGGGGTSVTAGGAGGVSTYGGNGGAGGGNGVGSVGTQPGGGGGASGSNAGGSRVGAAGAKGQCIVTTFS